MSWYMRCIVDNELIFLGVVFYKQIQFFGFVLIHIKKVSEPTVIRIIDDVDGINLWILEIILPDTNGAVSYTHLDVYKRQQFRY